MNREKNIDVSRYIDIVSWNFTIEVITPAFLGGAGSDAELRSASFKGLIRYWWRIVFGSQYGDNILQRESEIFGAATDDKKIRAGKSNVQIMIEPIKNLSGHIEKLNGKPKRVTSKRNSFFINLLEYLAFGVAVYDKNQRRNVISRTALKPGSQFNLTLSVSKPFSEEVLQAFLYLCKYGGVGAKNRNGFGSLHIINTAPEIPNLKTPAAFHRPKQKYSALSDSTRLFCTRKSYITWEEALSELADVYISIRKKIDSPHIYNNRGLMARPIVATGENVPDPVKNKRHPKFLFMNITRIDDGKYRGTILTLPIRFYEQENENLYNGMVKKVYHLLSESPSITDQTKTLIGESK